MKKKILVAPIFDNKEFESKTRSQGLTALTQLAEVKNYTADKFTKQDAANIIAVIADSALFDRSFMKPLKTSVSLPDGVSVTTKLT